MKIDLRRCTGCGMCIVYCPGGAIQEEGDGLLSGVQVAQDLCVECGLCRRISICPEDAFEESDGVGQYPRVTRALFSNPYTTHRLTLVPGRGTEESKTNDVTGRIQRGRVGLCIEFGRPGICSTFRDIAVMTTRLKALGVEFEQANPLTQLMDPQTGEFPEELISERLLSSIIEVKLPSLDDLRVVLPAIVDVSHQIDTVFSFSIVSRFDEDGSLPVLAILDELGIHHAPNAKVNLGLGRPLVES